MSDKFRSVLIIEARFYADLSDELKRGAVAELERAGVSHASIAVPGALEIPIALSLAIRAGVVGPGGKHQGCVALGCVIKGETSHNQIVGSVSAQGLMDVGTRHCVPIGNGILTVDTPEQAWARARVEGRNKGGDAARACLSLMSLAERLQATL